MAPGIATAQRLADAEVAYELVVSEKEVDSRLMSVYPDMPCRTAKAYPFSLHPYGLARFLMGGIYGFLQTIKRLGRERPRVVLAFGGFLMVNYVIAARLLRIPVVLHEANRKPGRAVRLLADMADAVFVPQGVSLRGVRPRRIHALRMPLRKECRHIRKDVVRERMNLPVHGKVLLVVGGSQGATVFNDWVGKHWPALAAERISVIVVTGPLQRSDLTPTRVQHSDGSYSELRVIAFADAMHELFSCADLVLSRAGAGSIAELTECLAPSILVPYPYAADDHQTANAREHERRGACVVIEQSHMAHMFEEVYDLIYSDWMLDRMRGNLRRMMDVNAAQVLARYLQVTFFKPVEGQEN